MSIADLKDLRRQLDNAIALIEQDQMRHTGFHSNRTYVGDFQITRVRGLEVKGHRATSIQFDEWNAWTCNHAVYFGMKSPRPRHCPACGTSMWDAGD